MAAEAKRPVRPHPQQMVKCPRCDSSETKFCYYNNYSTTQPRYFCKNCKRYWTDGGTLRNVPVGGGLRKNKRSKTKLAAATSSSSPPSSSTLHQKPSSSTPSLHASAANHSTISGHVGLPNPSSDNNHGLPHTPGYLVFNPRMFETDNQATSIPGQLPLYQQEVNYNHQFVPPPLPMLGGLKQHEPPLGGTPYFNAYGNPKDHERPLSESLQPGGFHHSSENNSVNYSTNNFVNVYDWQQVSEGLFGSVGDGNYMYMQPPQAHHWTEFDAGTRL